jgi:biopolymer transport protein ExbB
MTAKTAKKTNKGTSFHVSALLVLAVALVTALIVFNFIFGNPNNFEGFDAANYKGFFDGWWNFDSTDAHPANGNLLGTIYKGGVIVPIIQTLLLTVLILSIERFIAITRSQGKGSLLKFVSNIKVALEGHDLAKAQELCDKQGGSVGNVVNASLAKYAQMEQDTELTRDQKALAIQKEVEESTALELPMMEQNLPVIATMTTLGTLMGLLGTVIGMIKSFAALATGGSVDSLALSTGISEALVNTAFGIATGASAVIAYNYFTTKIDGITHAIDEVGFTIVQTFSTTHK